MRVLVVWAHPVPESFSAALAGTVVETLRAGGHEVDLLDLNRDGFDPVLSADERRGYELPDVSRNGVDDHVGRLKTAEALVLVFPTWWYGLPAILKGWFDRIWLPGVAFDLDPRGGRIRPALTNIRKLWVVTTAGSPWWFLALWLGHPTRKVVLRGLKPLCATGAEGAWLCHYSMDSSTAQSRARFIDKVRRRFARF